MKETYTGEACPKCHSIFWTGSDGIIRCGCNPGYTTVINEVSVELEPFKVWIQADDMHECVGIPRVPVPGEYVSFRGLEGLVRTVVWDIDLRQVIVTLR